ncbi:hypothetical protein [Cupriavidus sp. UBA2534]|uniref:hypothetical protein n=1 Tax=Cupriavidus sp. UBA2534 TaxID=1946399 RepID=UPI00257CAD15|nr:hypothetical protein [Cupriavidus sp. UBA2534]
MRLAISQTTRAKVLSALIAGRELNAPDFASEIGVSESTVAKIFRDIKTNLRRSNRRVASGQYRDYYTAVNTGALTRLRNTMTMGGGGNRHMNRGAGHQFSGLLDIWGIRAAEQVELPTQIHSIETPDDLLEECPLTGTSENQQ